MCANILKSDRANKVSIRIINKFVELRDRELKNKQVKELVIRMDRLEDRQDKESRSIWNAINCLRNYDIKEIKIDLKEIKNTIIKKEGKGRGR